jgi:tRNA threonylcarbamoyladenosine biosynthesis protein TsaE
MSARFWPADGVDYGIDDLGGMGKWLADRMMPGDVIGLSGDLGVGKTSLARAVLHALGLAGEAPSPSFAIVQPYAPPETRLPVWHVDLYRIAHADELDELGFDEARREHALLIEWPDRLDGRQWADMLHLHINAAAHSGALANRRRLTAEVPDAWRERWQ